MTYKGRMRLFWFSVALFLLIAPPVLFYATGWRITSKLTIERTGGLFIAVPESGSKVYLDGELKSETNFLQSGTFIQNLTPRFYSVLVAKDGYWPWMKLLPVKGSEVVEAKALLVAQTIDATPIAKTSPEYKTAANAIEKIKHALNATTTPAEFDSMKDKKGRARIW